jgi:hypothetical protein
MYRFWIAATACLFLSAMTGCVAGPHCNDCSGCGHGGYIAHGPLDAARQWRRSLSCGAGCGETYYGEWRSTPPDCVDPCPEFACGCGDAACGGCGIGHRRIHGDGCGIRPARAVARLVVALYGKRFCAPCDDCGSAVEDCGCDDGGSYESWEGTVEPAGSPGCNCGGHAATTQGMPGRIVKSSSPGTSSMSARTPVQMARQNQRTSTSQMARNGIPAPGKMAASQAAPQPGRGMRNAQRLPQDESSRIRR